ncbi:NAD(P)-dependent alcohol dehydrogenase [Luedemannella flava]
MLGSDIAGTVDAVGPGVTRFAAGDDVYGDILSYLGGFAEYVCVPEKVLEPLPEGMSHEEASAIPQAGMIALQGIVARGRVRAGEQVLINGAGGGSGSYAIQLAKLYGAEVTGVDNAGKLEFMRSMGADHVLDYRQTDYTATGDRYDLILDLVAYRSVAACARALAPGGRYFMVGGPVSTLLRVLVFGPLRGRIRVLAVQLGARHVGPLVELIRDGKVATVIDRRFPLAEVPDALRYVGEGHARARSSLPSTDHGAPRDLCQHGRRGRRPDPRPALDAELRLGGVHRGRRAGRDVQREPRHAARRARRRRDDGVVGDPAGGVGGVSRRPAGSRCRDGRLPLVAGPAARQTRVRRLSRRVRLPVRVLVPDPVRGGEPVLPLGARHQDVRDGVARHRLPGDDEAPDAARLVRGSPAQPCRADDAIEQGALFCAMLAANPRRPTNGGAS